MTIETDKSMKPRPAHEHTLERIVLWSEKRFLRYDADQERIIIHELMCRVIGVALPTPRKPAPNALIAETGPHELDLTIPTEMVAALELLKRVCRYDMTALEVSVAIAWVKETYLSLAPCPRATVDQPCSRAE